MRPRRLWAPAGSQSLRVHANLARPFGAPAATDGGSKGGEAERQDDEREGFYALGPVNVPLVKGLLA